MLYLKVMKFVQLAILYNYCIWIIVPSLIIFTTKIKIVKVG